MFGGRGAQERSVGGVVRSRVRVLQASVGNDGEIVLHRFERRKDGGELVELAFAGWRPAGLIAAHRDKDEAQAAHRFGRGLGPGCCSGDHGIEQRQGKDRAAASEECPPGNRFFCQKHRVLRLAPFFFLFAACRTAHLKRGALHDAEDQR